MRRRIICLAALAVTGALVYLAGLPGKTQLPGVPEGGRELVRIWTVSAIGGGQAWLSKALRRYEQTHPGVMTYLRTVDAEELTREGSVLPDLVLYMPGDVTEPECFAPLGGELAADEALLRCGRWRGMQLGLPLCWGGYVLAIGTALDPEAPTPAPTTLLGRPADTLPPSQVDPGYPLERANQMAEALQAPSGPALLTLALLPQVRPKLPENFGKLSAAAVYQRFAAGECASAVLTTGQMTALEGLAAAGKAPGFRTMAPETVITDQVWLGSVVNGGIPRAAEVLGWLTGQEAQRMLADQGLHPASCSLRLYAVGAQAELDRAAARSLTAINAFVPRETVAAASDQAFRQAASLDEALLPII